MEVMKKEGPLGDNYFKLFLSYLEINVNDNLEKCLHRYIRNAIGDW